MRHTTILIGIIISVWLVGAFADELSVPITLAPGSNTISIEADDLAGNTTATSINLEYVVPADTGSVSSGQATTPVTEPATVPGVIAIFADKAPAVEAETGQSTVSIVPQTTPSALETLPSPSIKPELPAPLVEKEEYSPSKQDYSLPEQEVVVAKVKQLPSLTPVKPQIPKLTAVEAVALKIETPEIGFKESKRILWVWHNYILKLKGIEDKAIMWNLEPSSKLPFGLNLNKKQGILYGFVWGKMKTNVTFLITMDNGKTLKADCALNLF